MTHPSELRPREKIQQRTQGALTDHELLQALIGSGTRKKNVRHIARELLKLLQKSSGHISYSAVKAIQGVGPAKAALVVAAFELSRRHLIAAEYIEPSGVPLSGSVYCRFYSGGNLLIDERWFPESIATSVKAYVRQVMVVALRSSATHIAIYDGVEVEGMFGRLQALHRRHALFDASSIVGVRISKYHLVHHDLRCEEII